MPGMKMAKASKVECNNAFQLSRLIDGVCGARGFEVPSFPDTDDEAGAEFDRESLEDLQKFHDQVQGLCGGLMRVVWGYEIMLDNVIDPELSHLELKPEILAAIAAADSEREAETMCRCMYMAITEEGIEDIGHSGATAAWEHGRDLVAAEAAALLDGGTGAARTGDDKGGAA